jgi:hypothetical protein
MRKIFAAIALFLFVNGAPISAASIADPGPPYTNEQFLEISRQRISNEPFLEILPSWWSRAPDYLRNRILNIHSTRWWSVIICNIQGQSKLEDGGYTAKAIQCEDEFLKAQARGKNSWTGDGRWIGPSEDCRRRDKRSEWGELICD